ncbi:MAG TPA: PQQ-dependent sugar dehydrogenase [Bacteroidia bacterium]|nr:PQQ-dependent sugar dehydrogenase [Bacteroidia bacterium]
MKSSVTWLVVIIFLAAISLLFFSFGQEKKPAVPIHLKLKLVSKGFISPIGMGSPKDGTNRLFIIEQRGKIKIIKSGKALPVPFLDVSDKLDQLNIAYSEKGLLGLAFHPAYKTNGRFFIYYSAPCSEKNYDHKSILAAYHVSSANPDIADIKEEILMEILEPESNHNGGCIQFGKDGYLYIGVGDGGGAGDEHGTSGNGQNLNTLLGKILRIDVDSKHPYAIPADNPFIGQSNVKPEIYAYGLRNPWRFSFDRVTGRLYCGDVGQNQWEETDIIEKGKNYGWRIMEGTHCYNPSSDCKTQGLAMPIDEYNHGTGISICGGYMYRGLKFPSLHGYYVFGDWNGKMFYLKQDKNATWNRGEVFLDDSNSNDIDAKLNSMGESENGELYVVVQHLFGPRSPTGAIYQISF